MQHPDAGNTANGVLAVPPSGHVVSEDALEVMGLDEVSFERQTVKARQRKSKSLASANVAGRPSRPALKDNARKDYRLQTTERTAVSPAAGKHSYRSSPKFAKMSLLDVDVSSTKRRDPSIYDMTVVTTESAESSAESLENVETKSGKRPVNVKNSGEKNVEGLAAAAKDAKQKGKTVIPSSIHTKNVDISCDSLGDVEPDTPTDPVSPVRKVPVRKVPARKVANQTKKSAQTLAPSNATEGGQVLQFVEPRKAAQQANARISPRKSRKRSTSAPEKDQVTESTCTPAASQTSATEPLPVAAVEKTSDLARGERSASEQSAKRAASGRDKKQSAKTTKQSHPRSTKSRPVTVEVTKRTRQPDSSKPKCSVPTVRETRSPTSPASVDLPDSTAAAQTLSSAADETEPKRRRVGKSSKRSDAGGNEVEPTGVKKVAQAAGEQPKNFAGATSDAPRSSEVDVRKRRVRNSSRQVNDDRDRNRRDNVKRASTGRKLRTVKG